MASPHQDVSTVRWCESAQYLMALPRLRQAVVLFGHRAAVCMHGYNGYFDLDELMPA